MATGFSPAETGKGGAGNRTPPVGCEASHRRYQKQPVKDSLTAKMNSLGRDNPEVDQPNSTAQFPSSPRQCSETSTALLHTGSTQNQQCPSCCTALESFPTLKGAQPDPPWNSRRREELAEVSAGKPLGSRTVLLLDLDFSFLRRERKAQTQGQRNTCCSRGAIPLSVSRSPEGCAQAGLFPWLWGHISK